MLIGELSSVTGVSTRSLRYYEQQGLITSERLANGYRDYPPDAVEVVAFIQDLFAAGLSSLLVKDVISCVAADPGGTPPPELLERVRQVRDDLVEQERRIRLRLDALDGYLRTQGVPAR